MAKPAKKQPHKPAKSSTTSIPAIVAQAAPETRNEASAELNRFVAKTRAGVERCGPERAEVTVGSGPFRAEPGGDRAEGAGSGEGKGQFDGICGGDRQEVRQSDLKGFLVFACGFTETIVPARSCP